MALIQNSENEMGVIYNYEIEPRPSDLGGGWRLRFFENDLEVGGGVFPPIEDIEEGNTDLATQKAYDDALSEASIWLATREQPGSI